METVKNKALLLLLTAILYISVSAQPPHTFTRYTAEDGLSQKIITSTLQDRKGTMWFATWDGIKKFDGYTFTNYKASLGSTIGLTNNRIEHIYEDQYGYIWLQNYDDQVYRFNPRTGEFQDIPYPGKYQAGAVYLLPLGDVWITTGQEGLIHIRTNPEDHILTAENFS